MADRARMAKIPQPEVALKCPRCESTNTKFCYYNNYSLSQPRHYCKACRRYWTRGGALRNVPVGGGCRRNKKSKSSNSNNNTSKSTSVSANNKQMGSSSSSENNNNMLGNLPQQMPQSPFMASLQNFTGQYNMGNLGLSFGAQTTPDVGFHQMGSNSSGGMHQFSQMFDQAPMGTSNLYQFHQNEGVEPPTTSSLVGEEHDQLNPRVSQMAPVKMEENRRINPSKFTFMGTSSENSQYWGGNNWTDLPSSGLN